jgi:uncharacterized damage-inducible protein DinB
MNTPVVFHQFFKYHYALMERVWGHIDQLADSQYYQEVPYSRGSLHDQMFHITTTDRAWLRGIKGFPRKPRLNPDDYPGRKQVRTLFDEVRTDVLEYIDSLTEDELDRVPDGFYGPVWQVLLHVVNHGTDHRAQILRVLYDFDIPTSDQDFILWLWRR